MLQGNKASNSLGDGGSVTITVLSLGESNAGIAQRGSAQRQ